MVWITSNEHEEVGKLPWNFCLVYMTYFTICKFLLHDRNKKIHNSGSSLGQKSGNLREKNEYFMFTYHNTICPCWAAFQTYNFLVCTVALLSNTEACKVRLSNIKFRMQLHNVTDVLQAKREKISEGEYRTVNTFHGFNSPASVWYVELK